MLIYIPSGAEPWVFRIGWCELWLSRHNKVRRSTNHGSRLYCSLEALTSYGALKSNFARRDFIQDVGWSGSEIPHTNASRQYKVKLSPPPFIFIYKVSSSCIYILENVIPLPPSPFSKLITPQTWHPETAYAHRNNTSPYKPYT
jgi:hypothetical protein